MSNYEAAAELLLQDWMNTLPTEFEHYRHSRRYEKAIKELLNGNGEHRMRRLTGKTLKILLIAAILLAIATAVIAATVGKDYLIRQFDGFSTYSLSSDSQNEPIGDVEFSYIPEGFELTDVEESSNMKVYYFANNDKSFELSVTAIVALTSYDTYDGDSIVVNYQDVEYIISGSNTNNSIIWNDNKCIYSLNSVITIDEALKIAQNIH